MDVGINNVIYMELHSGPKMANGTCGNDRSRFHCICFVFRNVFCRILPYLCYEIVTYSAFADTELITQIMFSRWWKGCTAEEKTHSDFWGI